MICRLGQFYAFKALLVLVSKLGGKINFRAYLVSLLAGENRCDVEAHAEIFVKVFLAQRKIDHTHQLLRAAQRNKDEVVLASGSLYPVVQAIAKALGVAGYSASTLVCDAKGVYTGEYLQDVKSRKEASIADSHLARVVVTDNLDDANLVLNAEEAIILSKQKNKKAWGSLLHDHPNYRIIIV